MTTTANDVSRAVWKDVFEIVASSLWHVSNHADYPGALYTLLTHPASLSRRSKAL